MKTSAKHQPSEITLRIILERPPADVDFGLQAGHGSTYEVTQKQRSKGRDLSFEFVVNVKVGRDHERPDFAGPFVQGAAGDRFVYIDIGTYAGQTNTPWSRRLKIPLNVITWDLIDSGMILVAHLPGAGKDGGPSCAYEWRKRVGPSWRWQIAK